MTNGNEVDSSFQLDAGPETRFELTLEEVFEALTVPDNALTPGADEPQIASPRISSSTD